MELDLAGVKKYLEARFQGTVDEPPASPEVKVNTAQLSIEEAARHLLNELEQQGLFQL